MGAVRDSNGKFVKGVSGNPGGVPKSVIEIKRALEECLPDAVQRLKQALKSDEPKLYVWATELVMEYTLSKPKQEQSIELSGTLATNAIDKPPPETREQWIERVSREMRPN